MSMTSSRPPAGSADDAAKAVEAPPAEAGPPPHGNREARRAPSVPSGWRRRLWRLDAAASPYVFISPFFVLFLLIGLFPLGYTAWVSLHDWSLLGGKGDYAGLENFRRVLDDRYFWNALRNTISIFLLSSIPQVLIALVVAALLDANLRARTLWRMAVLLPFVVAPAAVALIFGNVFGDRYGLINAVLTGVGLPAVSWHVNTLASHLAIASMVNWRWTGYNTLILLAAMQAVPRDVYESAALDGAGPVRRFTSLTVPLIRPTVIFVIITSTIGGLQIFTEPRLFDTQGLGGSDRQYQTLTMYLWELGWRVRDLGMAAAVAWLLFLLIIAIALVNLAWGRRLGRSGR